MLPRIALAALLAAGPALAADGPSFDCAKAQSEAEELVCGDAELAALDRRLADRYAAALAVARGLDAGAAEAEDTLRTMQRGWVKGRDDCWKAEDPRACVADAYLRREGELVATWLLEEPASTAIWDCEGMVQIATQFFDTALPSVRLELGDTVDAGVLSPTASGAKYEASFGRSLWIKGAEALYREADPDGTEHACTLAGEG